MSSCSGVSQVRGFESGDGSLLSGAGAYRWAPWVTDPGASSAPCWHRETGVSTTVKLPPFLESDAFLPPSQSSTRTFLLAQAKGIVVATVTCRTRQVFGFLVLQAISDGMLKNSSSFAAARRAFQVTTIIWKGAEQCHSQQSQRWGWGSLCCISVVRSRDRLSF